MGRSNLLACIPHNVAGVITKLHYSDASLNVPEHAGHVTGGSDDLTIVDEPTAREIAGVGTQLTRALYGTDTALLGTEVVNGADIVETAAGYKITRGGVCACHDPGGAEGDGMDFVCRIGIPNDELAVLGGGDEMALVCCPVHCVYLCQMALERPPGLHHDPRECLYFCRHRTYFSLISILKYPLYFQKYAQLVSAVASFFARIFSLSESASRRAEAILGLYEREFLDEYYRAHRS
jgi:hypothetical protein